MTKSSLQHHEQEHLDREVTPGWNKNVICTSDSAFATEQEQQSNPRMVYVIMVYMYGPFLIGVLASQVGSSEITGKLI